MRTLSRTPVTPVWLVLVAATAISWWLGADQGLGAGAQQIATVLIMTVAFVKVSLVGMYFMELREAPAAMRLFFGGWCGVVLMLIIVLYLTG